MNEKEFVAAVVTAFEESAIPYFITGGMAAIAYGEVRFTNDLDVVANLQTSDIPRLLTRFPTPDYYLSEAAMRDAVAKRTQFNIIHPSSGNKVDVMVSALNEYDRLRLERKRRLTIDSEFAAYFATPEDVILKKLQFFQMGGSEKHLRDIAGMISIRGDQLQQEYILDWAKKLNVADEWKLVQARASRNT